ncbi:hypothetical protein COOONC_03870, partial [Cooperia oncophora]
LQQDAITTANHLNKSLVTEQLYFPHTNIDPVSECSRSVQFQRSLQLQNVYRMAHNKGVLAGAGEKAQELSEKTAEKLSHAGTAVKDTIASGYEKVKDTAASAYEKVAGSAKENYDEASRKVDEKKDQLGRKMDEKKDQLGWKKDEKKVKTHDKAWVDRYIMTRHGWIYLG